MQNKGKNCIAKNCNKNAFCKGYCTKHYQQIYYKGEIKQKEFVYVEGLCKIIGCGKKLFAKGFCQNHYLENKGD